MNYLCDYTDWDFLWEPPPWQSHQRHAWASQWQKDSATYLVPKSGYQDTNYHDAPVIQRRCDQSLWQVPNGLAADFDYSWHPDPTEPPMTYQFGTQWQKTGGPVYVNGGTVVKYITQPRSTKLSVDPNWDIPPGTDPDSFDWTWHPDATEQNYIYQFGTQHQRTGGPRYVTEGATDIKFVDQLRIRSQRVATAIIEIDHLDGNAGQIPNVTKTSRYFDNYFDTLKRIAKNIAQDHEFVWICSSICDYTDFDFSWHPEQWQATMLHVFPSDGEKFGDTFFMHVPTFQYRADTCQLLEWYDLHFVEDKGVPRRPLPVIRHNEDTHVDAVKTANIPGPLAVFVSGNREIGAPAPPVPLWREKTKTVVPLTSSGDTAIVPRVAVPYIQTQLYDYAWIDKTHKSFYPSQLQDIVFISYDEPQADENWAKLKSRFPRATRVHGVAGMENALIAAADASTTPWYFAVFAKTDLANEFKFDFVPDYLQQVKHYVFDCENTVNGLRYGHMGIVMYNCAMVQQGRDYDKELGLDYTLSFPHEVVPLLSCYGRFDSSPYHTWRTAFREASKLAYFNSVEPCIDGQYRLKVWTKHATGPHAEWCLRGAADGVEFFQESQSNLAYLKQGFRWEWLRQRFVDRWGDLD